MDNKASTPLRATAHTKFVGAMDDETSTTLDLWTTIDDVHINIILYTYTHKRCIHSVIDAVVSNSMLFSACCCLHNRWCFVIRELVCSFIRIQWEKKQISSKIGKTRQIYLENRIIPYVTQNSENIYINPMCMFNTVLLIHVKNILNMSESLFKRRINSNPFERMESEQKKWTS